MRLSGLRVSGLGGSRVNPFISWYYMILVVDSQVFFILFSGGQPGFNSEMTGHLKKSDEIDENSVKNTKSSPLELYLEHVVDTGKGCYQ